MLSPKAVNSSLSRHACVSHSGDRHLGRSLAAACSKCLRSGRRPGGDRCRRTAAGPGSGPGLRALTASLRPSPGTSGRRGGRGSRCSAPCAERRAAPGRRPSPPAASRRCAGGPTPSRRPAGAIKTEQRPEAPPPTGDGRRGDFHGPRLLRPAERAERSSRQ